MNSGLFIKYFSMCEFESYYFSMVIIIAFGGVIGSFLFGFLSDIYGRKIIIQITLCISTLSTFGIYFLSSKIDSFYEKELKKFPKNCQLNEVLCDYNIIPFLYAQGITKNLFKYFYALYLFMFFLLGLSLWPLSKSSYALLVENSKGELEILFNFRIYNLSIHGLPPLITFLILIALNNLKTLLELKLNDLYAFDFKNYFKDVDKSDLEDKVSDLDFVASDLDDGSLVSDLTESGDKSNKGLIFEESSKPVAVVATSGGTDSSFSLILAKKLGFNPIAVTVDPGTIVLPKQFKSNIDKICDKLEVESQYIPVDYSDLIAEAFTGRFHPCGRCSKIIEETVYKYAADNGIRIVIFGDMPLCPSFYVIHQAIKPHIKTPVTCYLFPCQLLD